MTPAHVQPDLAPGAQALLSGDWRAERWPVRAGHPARPFSWDPSWAVGPVGLLVLARLPDPFGQDDLLVLEAGSARAWWTYLDPAHAPGAVPCPRLTARVGQPVAAPAPSRAGATRAPGL